VGEEPSQEKEDQHQHIQQCQERRDQGEPQQKTGCDRPDDHDDHCAQDSVQAMPSGVVTFFAMDTIVAHTKPNVPIPIPAAFVTRNAG